jgi:hypothetical protein
MANWIQVDAEIQHLHQGTRVEAVKAVRNLYPAADIISIDGEPFVGFCEVCGEPLFNDSDYMIDADCVRWCRSHDLETKAAKQRKVRTK